MVTVVISVICSVIAAIIVTRKMATCHFEIVDDHVNKVAKATEEFVQAAITRLDRMK